MARRSPMHAEHEAAGASFAAYGPDDAAVPVVQVYTGLDREYAAVRRGAAIFDWPQRGVLSATGRDRIGFLNRMVTQEVRGVAEGGVALALWLNRKGRIDAELAVVGAGERCLLDVDVHAAGRAHAGLSGFIISDDVTLTDETERVHRLAVHGPRAAEAVAREARPTTAAAAAITELGPMRAGVYEVGGRECVIWRVDSAGEVGLEIAARVEDAAAVYGRLAEGPIGERERAGRGLELLEQAGEPRCVRAGWHAYNVARIEAGTPMYNIDYGPASLPHETGVLHERVSFRKGCYLGQEIVARMEARGGSKQVLVGLRVEGGAVPEAGAGVRGAEGADAAVVGAVTSAAMSPMLGSAVVAFAMVRKDLAREGAKVWVEVEGGLAGASVGEGLGFWRRG